MVGSSSQQRQLITYHVEFTEEEHPQPAPSPEHSLAYRRPRRMVLEAWHTEDNANVELVPWRSEKVVTSLVER